MLVERKQFQEVMNCFIICAHPVNEMVGASHVKYFSVYYADRLEGLVLTVALSLPIAAI